MNSNINNNNSPSQPITMKRSHKRSNSHGLPSKPILYHSPPANQYLLPPTQTSPLTINPNVNVLPTINARSPTTILYTANLSPPSSISLVKSPTIGILSNNNYNNSNYSISNGNNSNNSHRTWSPSTTGRKKKPPIDPLLFIAPQQQQQPLSLSIPIPIPPQHHMDVNGNKSSPPASPRTRELKDINHRRAVSWDTQVGKQQPIEKLNQIIKEKREAILQRERELLIKQKILEHEFNSRTNSNNNEIGTSPSITTPLSSSIGSSSTVAVPSSSNSTPSPHGTSPPIPSLLIQSPPIQVQQQQQQQQVTPLQQSPLNRPVVKHNRSKSDTVSVMKNLSNLKNQQLQQQQQQQLQLLLNQHHLQSPPSLSSSSPSQQQYVTSPITNSKKSTTRIPINSPKLQHSSTSNLHHYSISSSSNNNSNNNSPAATTTTTTTYLSSPVLSAGLQPIPQHYSSTSVSLVSSPSTSSSSISKAPRRKSVDPMTFISLNQQQNYIVNNNNNANHQYTNHKLYHQQQQYYQHQQLLQQHYNQQQQQQHYNQQYLHQHQQQYQQHQHQQQQQYSKHNSNSFITAQILNSLKNMDIEEFEEELDKEIQQVILQTKSIQGKVDLLERVRCTAPDPLLMLFGENCKSVVQNKKSSSISPSTTSSAFSPAFTSSNNNNINNNINNNNTYSPIVDGISFQDTRPLGVPTRTSRKKPIQSLSRCPDKTKSKNLNSLPRASAFSPPPRPI
ncbi:hypothetical protein CYY_001358 [Polysphondylium violaceum]|uniref:Uncharacterized protein n=1 Tax=Polysphondylium violaceum TaxID=133409 RepID=A0A8J4V1Q5_9MYCE|nr:hypothetical protein CYY_001358 [Polysphondylium violaceum]